MQNGCKKYFPINYCQASEIGHNSRDWFSFVKLFNKILLENMDRRRKKKEKIRVICKSKNMNR